MLEHVIKSNFILSADGYKINHYLEMPSDSEYTYVVVVPRKPSKYSDHIVAMGQTLVTAILSNVRIDHAMIDEAEFETAEQGYEFNRRDWEIIVDEFDGKLPLEVYAIDEGLVIKPQTPIMGIINTDPRFYWLPTYIETFVQSIIWKMSTVASICRTVRTTLQQYIIDTGTSCTVDYMLHNFGDRGADSPESAIIAGMAHAALFNGSDCIQANRYIKKLYNTKTSFLSSIEATEHSVMSSNSNNKNDFDAAVMAVDRLYQQIESNIATSVLSVVIDTYDSRRFVQDYLGSQLHDRIVNSGGKLVCRPDSGDPTIEPGLVGNDIISKFGFTYNAHGLKVLPNYIGVIQGDGIRIDTFESVIKGWINAGFTLDNFCLGMGSGVTHDGARDDFSFSMKAVALKRGNKWIPLSKDPITDSGKKSLTGLIQCCIINNELSTITQSNHIVENDGWKLWFKDGERMIYQTFESVRDNARS
jgi:nicotinamide phosphoribosyltransferase